MSTETSPAKIFKHWKSEDLALQGCLNEVRHWMREVSLLGIPHFGETATRLRPLREYLVRHFEREDELIAQLATSYASSLSPELDAVRTASAREHRQLLIDLDDLMIRLNQTEPPFASWEAAMGQVDRLVDTLDQHEARESGSIEALIRSKPR